MVTLFPTPGSLFEQHLRTAAARLEAAAQAYCFHQVLDVTRLVRAVFPTATRIVVTGEYPADTMLQQVLDHTSHPLWERNRAPSSALRAWRTDDDHPWAAALQTIDRCLAEAVCTEDPHDLGWPTLDQPGGFHILRLPHPDLLAGQWVYAADAITPDPHGYTCARTDCPHCHGQGVIDTPPNTRRCVCARTAQW